jgi:hypothetical protein
MNGDEDRRRSGHRAAFSASPKLSRRGGLIEKQEAWRDRSPQEWRQLRDQLGTSAPWTDDQWRLANEYLDGQFEHNFPRETTESPELGSSPLSPNRHLYPQAQVIQMLAIQQLRRRRRGEG